MAEINEHALEEAVTAAQRENRPKNGMFNGDQLDAMNEESRPAYRALIRAAILAYESALPAPASVCAGEPVAYRYEYLPGRYMVVLAPYDYLAVGLDGKKMEPLYTAPPASTGVEAAKASLLVLCAIRDAQSWHANMLKDIDFAIEANRVALRQTPPAGKE